MDDIFFPDEPAPESRAARWLRIYRLPLVMLAAFSALLVAFALMPNPEPQPVADVIPRTSTPEPPRQSPCPACGVGHTCDPDTGECVLVERTPVPCVRGSSYDEELGFCIPDEPPPTPAPARTAAPARPTPATPAPTPAVEETPRPTKEPAEPDPPAEPEPSD